MRGEEPQGPSRSTSMLGGAPHERRPNGAPSAVPDAPARPFPRPLHRCTRRNIRAFASTASGVFGPGLTPKAASRRCDAASALCDLTRCTVKRRAPAMRTRGDLFRGPKGKIVAGDELVLSGSSTPTTKC